MYKPEEDETPQLVQIAQKPKRSHSFFRLTMAFLLGALVYAGTVGVYNLMHPKEESNGITVISQPATSPALAPQKTSVSEEDLKKYVTPIDCTTIATYAKLSTLTSLAAVQSISLYDGIRAQTGTTSGVYQWKTLPIVVDYKCKEIKITDIATGDRVNFYTDKDAISSAAIKDIKVVQKANL